MTAIQLIILELSKKLTSPLISDLLAQQEAWWMLEALTGKSQATLFALDSLELSSKQQEQLKQWVVQRVGQKKPLQYILGSVPFCGLTIKVRPPILIPRQETEEWTTWLIELLKQQNVQSLSILDLCSGTGCIGIALAHHFPQARVVGIDINPAAIKIAQENKALNNLENIEFIESDLYSALSSDMKFDLIVTNPPYLSSSEYEAIADDVKLWEDPHALVAHDRGMQLYHQIIKHAKKHLKDRGGQSSLKIPALVCEIGPAQKDLIQALLKAHNFKNVELFKDLQHTPRWTAAYI